MNVYTLGTIAVSVVLLAACEDSGATEEAFDQAKYNQFVEARADAQTVDTQVFATDLLTAAPANDTATLVGAFSIGSGGLPNDLEGEMSMDVDFGAETVSGSFTNAFLDPDGTDESSVVELDGSASFSGSIDMDRDTFYDSGNTQAWHIEASSTGTFTDVSTEDEATATTYRIDVDINGDFFDTSTIGTVGGVGELGDIASEGMIEGNIDVTTTTDTTIYDVTDGWYFVYELAE